MTMDEQELTFMKKKAREIALRMARDENFLAEVRANPTARLQRAGLSTAATSVFLRENGYPALNTPGFTPRNSAEYQAGHLSRDEVAGTFCQLIGSCLTSFVPCPGTHDVINLRGGRVVQIPKIYAEPDNH